MAGSLWPPLEGEGTAVGRWPLRKFPLLVDSERNIVEASIIIEYLQLAHPGSVRRLVRSFGHPRT
jgi:glutathione S-transferase